MLRPLNDFVVVARDDAEEMIGSIIIPGAAKEKLTRGVVLAVGPGVVQANKLADQLEEALREVRRECGSTAKASQAAQDVIEALRRKAPTVKPGDRVLFGRYSGNEARVTDDNGVERECVLMREEEIYGLIEE